ncbi:MAG: RdgB/HAM1 family non-canonical purine NTP pyrophosphatase [Candidatus Omnitrophica bacterium]|nr:RdgB/HAM1 family non-canonical purine NTP pyrophosphatase [Candidatus Omnitrophota bacterium]
MTFLLATRNRKKAAEFKRLLKGFPVRFLTLDLFPELPPVKEDGASFKANAIKKAVEPSRRTILPVLAEDSGLEVKELGGRPGVRSARFAGAAQDDHANVAKLLRSMKKVPNSRRQARFVCCMALAAGGRLIRTFQGTCSGSIARQPAGRTGFGYDPVFIPWGHAKTMAQLGPRLKDRLSHRSRAAMKLKQILEDVLEVEDLLV